MGGPWRNACRARSLAYGRPRIRLGSVSMSDDAHGMTIEIVPVTTLGSQRIESQESEHAPSRVLRIICWVLFGVGFAWVPLIVRVLGGSESSTHLTLTLVLSHGELLLISAVITAGALGDLFVSIGKSGRRMTPKVLTAGLLMLNFASTAMYYAVLQFQVNPPLSQSRHVANLSLWFFAFAFVISLAAMLQTEHGD